MDDGLIFEATKDGSVKIERCVSGVVIDRVIAHFGRPVKRHDKWILDALRIINAPSAEVVITVPPVPLLEPTNAQRLEMETKNGSK